MAIYHVHFVCAPDYMARRLPFRPAHLKQLASLRDDGRVVAGGPEPDGRAANIFYRVVDRAELDRLLAENEFNRAPDSSRPIVPAPSPISSSRVSYHRSTPGSARSSWKGRRVIARKPARGSLDCSGKDAWRLEASLRTAPRWQSSGQGARTRRSRGWPVPAGTLRVWSDGIGARPSNRSSCFSLVGSLPLSSA
jgi:uncharacterized protein YciI